MFAPFRGLLFDPTAVSDPGAATSPPYDVIDSRDRIRLEAASPHNVVRLLLGVGDDADRYRRAAAVLAGWRRDGILVADATERFYLYRMTGADRTVRGVLGALRLREFGEGILPHEETMESFREDRYAVLAATGANLDPIITLSASPVLAGLLEPAGPARLSFAVDGLRHELFDVADPAAVAAISGEVAGHPVSIADGHHRYTTALRYARDRTREAGAGPWDAILAFMAPARGGGLSIGPYHRGIPEIALRPDLLGDAFAVTPAAPEPPQDPGSLVLVPGSAHGAGPLHLAPHERAREALPPPWREASSATAREILYPRVGATEDGAAYFPDTESALTWLGGHPPGAVVLTAPVTEAAVAAAAEMGLRFPQKSTFFRPKPRAGLVLRPFRY